MLPLLVSYALAVEQPPALPDAGLHWAPATDQRFHYALRSDVTLPEPVRLDTGQWLTRVTLDTTLVCRATEPGPSSLRLQCELADVSLGTGLAAPRTDDESVRRELSSIARQLQDAPLALGLSRPGRLRKVDLEGRGIPAWLRPVVARAVAGFDLPLPPSPEAKTWDQRQVPWLHGVDPKGPLSRGSVVHRRVASMGGLVNIDSRGTVHRTWFDPALRPRSGQQIAFESTALFDASYGVLAERVWTVSGDPRDPHVQSAHLTLLDVTREGDR